MSYLEKEESLFAALRQLGIELSQEMKDLAAELIRTHRTVEALKAIVGYLEDKDA